MISFGSVSVLVPLVVNGPIYMLQYATQWTMICFTLNAALAFRAASQPSNTDRFRAAQILSQISISFSFSTTLVFWTFVAPEYITVVTFIWKFALISTHTLPLLLLIVHLFLTSAQLKVQDWCYAFAVTVCYCCFNYYFTYTLGAPVYPFLTWEFIPESAFYCCLSWGFGQLCCIAVGLLHGKMNEQWSRHKKVTAT